LKRRKEEKRRGSSGAPAIIWTKICVVDCEEKNKKSTRAFNGKGKGREKRKDMFIATGFFFSYRPILEKWNGGKREEEIKERPT